MTKKILVFLLYACSLSALAALDPAQVNQLVAEDSSDKVAAIQQLTQTADPDAVRVLKAMAEDNLFLAGDKAVIIDGGQAFDAASGAALTEVLPPRNSRPSGAGCTSTSTSDTPSTATAPAIPKAIVRPPRLARQRCTVARHWPLRMGSSR